MKSGVHGTTQFKEALTRVPICPRSKGNTQITEVNPLYGPRDSMKPGTNREVLIMATNKRALYFDSFTISPLEQKFP
jgi:hypothetical protein